MTDKENLETAAREYAHKNAISDTNRRIAATHFIAGSDWREKQMGWKKYDPENPPPKGAYVLQFKGNRVAVNIIDDEDWQYYNEPPRPITHYLPLRPSPPQGEKG